jgi:RNA polymerase sigma-70 factor, ECF subfamily
MSSYTLNWMLPADPNPESDAQPFAENRVSKDMEAVAAVFPSTATLERDAQLMLRVREGDTQSFALLLERHRGPVINFIYRMVQNQPVAEELAQEVFLRVYRSRETYEPTAKFTTWLFRIATHLALNYIRDGKHEKIQDRLDGSGAVINKATEEDASVAGGGRQIADRALSVEQNMVRESRLAEIREAIEALPEKQRAAVLMHKYQELGYAQIAGALGCTESALKSLLFRAYETLRAKLAHLA